MDVLGPNVDDDEFILRRIPVSMGWFDPEVSEKPAPDAFRPHPQHDVDGLSVSRAPSPAHPDFLTPAQLASQGRSPSGYHVAVLSVRDLRRNGIQLVPAPLADDPGHALLPDVNSANRKSNRVAEWKQLLANKLTLRVEGPFAGAPVDLS